MSLAPFVLKSRSLARFTTTTMHEISKNHDYETCIQVLNTLQSNAQYIKLQSQKGTNHNAGTLVQVERYLMRAGLSLDKLDGLSVIHVAGTKGKGTTCAYSERILREHGYKTGFFSSPHLLEVRERIRINGKPIEKSKFSKCFWRIYTLLQKSDECDMPLYFRFLTIMAFSIFLEEKVDVAIVEVGIGGEYDCTNILRKVPVVGITSLGIDHVSLLGSTIESIAWNKAGIMKEGCRAFTVPQPDGAMDVLEKRSVEKKCQLEMVDQLSFKFSSRTSCPAEILNLNASLAVALCQAWISSRHKNNGFSHCLSKELTTLALSNCIWPGRFQIKYENIITYYLDGAHTIESVTICSNWFKEVTRHSKKKKALMFNITGNRDPTTFLRQLHTCMFNAVLFVTNKSGNDIASDNISFISSDECLDRCQQNKQLWSELDNNCTLHQTKICEIFPTISEAINFLTNQDEYDLLVTGSLHLIGSVLSILEPNLNDKFIE